MLKPENHKQSSREYSSLEEYVEAFKSGLGSLGSLVNQTEEPPSNTKTYEITFFRKKNVDSISKERSENLEPITMIQEVDEQDPEKRIEEFKKEYQRISEKYRIDIGTKLVFTERGIAPTLVLLDLEDAPKNESEQA